MRKRAKELIATLMLMCMLFGSAGMVCSATDETGAVEPTTKSVTYKYNYPNNPDSQTGTILYYDIDETAGISNGDSVYIPESPTYSGYVFTGWYGYMCETLCPANQLVTISTYFGSASNLYDLTAGWSQVIPYYVNGKKEGDVTADDSYMVPIPSAPSDYTVDSWTLNDVSYNETVLELGSDTTAYITRFREYSAYKITQSNPKIEFVSFCRPSSGYLLNLTNSTGKALVMNGKSIPSGSSYGVYDSFAAVVTDTSGNQYSNSLTLDVAIQGAQSSYVEYDDLPQVLCYPVTLSSSDLTLTGIGGADTYSLSSGVGYELLSSLTVSGDPSTYSSGITFYVPTTGNYTFQ